MKSLSNNSRFSVYGALCLLALFLTCVNPHMAQAQVDSIKVGAFKQDLDIMEPNLTPVWQYIKKAQELYFTTFTKEDSPETRDAGFLAFYTYYLSVLEKISADGDFVDELYQEEKLAKAQAIAADAGFKVEHAGEGTFEARPDTNYLAKIFTSHVSPAIKAYFTFVKAEAGFIQDAGLMVTHEELRESIILGDTIMQKYPDSTIASMVQKPLNSMVHFYLLGVDNTPIYGAKRILLPEVKASFNRFLKENKQSTFYPAVKYTYDLLQKNNFKVSTNSLKSIVKKLDEMNITW